MRRINKKRLIIVLSGIVFLLLLWLTGYLMAINGILSVPNGYAMENAFWNAYFLFLALAVIGAVVTFAVAVIFWIFSR